MSSESGMGTSGGFAVISRLEKWCPDERERHRRQWELSGGVELVKGGAGAPHGVLRVGGNGGRRISNGSRGRLLKINFGGLAFYRASIYELMPRRRLKVISGLSRRT